MTGEKESEDAGRDIGTMKCCISMRYTKSEGTEAAFLREKGNGVALQTGAAHHRTRETISFLIFCRYHSDFLRKNRYFSALYQPPKNRKDMENTMPEWSKEMNCAVTVCDTEGMILYMNDKAKATYIKHGNLIGKNLMDCHNERSKNIIRHLLDTGGKNAYTIEKNGIKKMIYQTAWCEKGIVRGLVEISMEIPEEMPHYVRS